MKNKKNILIYYLIIIVLSLISLYSFKNKGNDILTATASLTADFTLIISVLLIIYILFVCFNYMKDKIDKLFDFKVLISISLLTLTMFIVFVSYINIFSHKDILEFTKSVIKEQENMDLIKLFLESCFIYYFIFLCGVNGLIISKKYSDEDTTYMVPVVVIITVVIISLLLMKIGIRLMYFITIIDIILYITAKILLKNRKVSK